LFSPNDWQCFLCSNINWAKRDKCNVCGGPKPGGLKESRSGKGGGHLDREEVVYKKRDEDDGEKFDDMGRLKKKYRRQNSGDESGDGSDEQDDRSPKKDDKSPKKRDTSPKKRDTSPKKRDTSPKKRDTSPKKRDASPKKRDTSPKKRDMSPKRRDPSPKNKNKEKDDEEYRLDDSNGMDDKDSSPSKDDSKKQQTRKDDYGLDAPQKSTPEDNKHKDKEKNEKPSGSSKKGDKYSNPDEILKNKQPVKRHSLNTHAATKYTVKTGFTDSFGLEGPPIPGAKPSVPKTDPDDRSSRKSESGSRSRRNRSRSRSRSRSRTRSRSRSRGRSGRRNRR